VARPEVAVAVAVAAVDLRERVAREDRAVSLRHQGDQGPVVPADRPVRSEA
jgi:hypothetical protein